MQTSVQTHHFNTGVALMVILYPLWCLSFQSKPNTKIQITRTKCRGKGANGTVIALDGKRVKKTCNTHNEVVLVQEHRPILYHPNLIPIQSTNTIEQTIVMEDGGYNLTEVLTGKADFTISHIHVLPIVKGICNSIAHLHKHHFAHCDIKTLNIMLHADSPTTPKLCDFGTLHELCGQCLCSSTSLPHVFHYASTAVLNHETPLTTFNTDWFACAVVLYTLYVHVHRYPNQPFTEASRPFRVHAYREPWSENRQVLPIQTIYKTLIDCQCTESLAQWISQALHEHITEPPSIP